MNAFKLGFLLLFIIAIIASFVALITQNQDTISINFLAYTTAEYPKWALLSASILLGSLFSALFFVVQMIVLETRNIRLRRANRQLERALAQYSPTVSKSLSASAAPNRGPAVSLDASLEEEV